MASEYTWDAAKKRYRDANGAFVTQTELKAAQSRLIRARSAAVRKLTADVMDEVIGTDTWVVAMRSEIRTSSVGQYMLGRGGRNAMLPADYGRVGGLVRTQYSYLQLFAEEINAGAVTKERAIERSEMYIESTRVMKDRGAGAAWDIALPAFPKEGTNCGPACRCSWSISETAAEIRAYWRTNSAHSCGVCSDRAAEYSPYVIVKETT